MSYTNPKQYIDTQSAKSIMGLQQSVSDSYSSFVKQRSQSLEKQRIQQEKEDKEREKKDEANKKQIAKSQEKLSKNFVKAALGGGGKINTMPLANQTIKEYVDVFKENEIDPNPDNIKQKTYFESIPDKVRASLEVAASVYNEEYEERFSNMGLPGGFSKYNNDDSNVVGGSVTSDDPYYTKTLELDEKGKVVISFINENGFYKTWPQGYDKEGERIIADVSSIESADTNIVIPDYSKTISAIDKDINEQLGIGREEGDAYKESKLLNKEGVPGQTIYYKEADMDMIRKKYEKKIETEYFENGAEGMIAFYNNIVLKESKKGGKVIKNEKGRSWERNNDNEIDDANYDTVKNAFVDYMLGRNEKLYQNLVVGKKTETETKTDKKSYFSEKQINQLSKNLTVLTNPQTPENFSYKVKLVGPDDINTPQIYTIGLDSGKIIATDSSGNSTLLAGPTEYYNFLGIKPPAIQ